MSLTMVAIVAAASIAAVALAASGMMFRSMFIATGGRKISAYAAPRKALVVLDIQEGYAATGARQPVTSPPADGMILTINRLIDKAAGSGMDVVYIRQVFSNNLFVRLHGGRKQGTVVIDRRIKVINENDFEKNRTDAFSSRQFEQFLVDRKVSELYLVGVDAAYCVYYTALGALNRGYKVAVVKDAVKSRNSMTKVLKRFKRKGITVVTSRELIDVSCMKVKKEHAASGL